LVRLHLVLIGCSEIGTASARFRFSTHVFQYGRSYWGSQTGVHFSWCGASKPLLTLAVRACRPIRSRVYVAVERLSVRLSHRSTAAAVAGGFAAKRPAGRRYQSSAAGAAYTSCRRAQQHLCRGMALSSKCGQCRVDSRGTSISPGSLNRVPASAGVRARMSPLPGGR